jgi:hypothetical protein
MHTCAAGSDKRPRGDRPPAQSMHLPSPRPSASASALQFRAEALYTPGGFGIRISAVQRFAIRPAPGPEYHEQSVHSAKSSWIYHRALTRMFDRYQMRSFSNTAAYMFIAIVLGTDWGQSDLTPPFVMLIIRFV